jgi:osmotically-inducible protein OsmY
VAVDASGANACARRPYFEDASITTAVKTKFVEDKTVDAGAIKVETLNGAVALSGFAKSNAEKVQAEKLVRSTKGVREVRNNVIVRP